jgi:hypothetical protein
VAVRFKETRTIPCEWEVPTDGGRGHPPCFVPRHARLRPPRCRLRRCPRRM